MLKDLQQSLNWEKSKVLEKGAWNLVGISLILLYFIYFPKALSYIYPQISSYTLYQLYTVGTYLAHLSAYLSINLLYYYIYKSSSPYCLKHKINPGPWPWELSTWPDLKSKVIKSALINQLITLPLGLLVFGLRAKYEISQPLPTFSQYFPQILFFIVCEDFCFYWSHRLLHTSFLYKRIHKQHHEFNVSISIAAEYAHPVEYLLGNSLPVALGPMIYGQSRIHIVTWFTWVFIRTLNTGEGHSGLNFPWSPFRVVPFSSTSTFHDYHHYKNVGNYGSFLIVWDTLFGTHRTYMKSFENSPMKID